MISFQGKKVLIFGLGIQGGGVGVAKFFAEHKAKVRVTDLKNREELDESLKKLKEYEIKYTLGGHKKTDFLWADLVIRNPDVPLDSPYLKFCWENKIPVEMDESLFMKLCPLPVIGVTGTRGKSTVTTLIGTILKEAGYHVLLGGNLRGIATLSLLDKIKKNSQIVLELSSWQLQSFGWEKISPHIAVITNIYPDHLNRYQSMADYVDDKRNIFKFQKKEDFLILNGENEESKTFKKTALSQVIFFKKADLSLEIINSWFLPGAHNLENLAAALAVAKIFKINPLLIKKATAKFKGLPFRFEFTRNLNDVTYINDSASTMPVATIKALKTITNKPVILICGGNSKNLPLPELINEIKKRVKKVVLLEGTATGEIESGIKNYELRSGKKIIIGRFDDLRKAIVAAKNEAQKGDVVLFSPAATSFSMFKNEFDRGEKFNEIVRKLN